MTARVVADGKHLSLDGRPFRVRGVTYGSFVPRLDGELFPPRDQVKRDLHAIAGAGFNTVRTYTVPPEDVLDLAAEYDLRLLVGLHHHDWRSEPVPGRDARRRVRDAGRRAVAEAAERCARRSQVLAVAVGNELPADLVRLHGIGSVREILGELVAEVHAALPDVLATYVNFPTTEFLEVEGQDVVCFNVFLEDPASLRAYLRHLQVVSRDRPLVVTELGLAAGVHGEPAQAESLRRQLDVVDEVGVAGATVFSFTDEWGVAGVAVEGWGFGLTDASRLPKPAFGVASRWARRSIVELRAHWPRVSVVVCAYNEERTIGDCLSSLVACEYPDLEVIVCDDGSTDRTLEVARRFPFRVLALPHGGLSRGRNAGFEASTGEVVAYLDADATCHPEWPFHLVLSLDDENVVATGGPNLAFEGAGFVERAVARSPGGPAEVLVADDRAEHVPGCNMAYRRTALERVGGFDPAYTAAGDDVDVCWKLLDRGEEIAFAPAAQVRHHRRGTVRGYLRQQRGYGRAEKMLTGAHPHRFNRLGQARWAGFIYGGAAILPALLRPVVYHGYMGGAPFQPVARRRAEIANMWSGALLPLTVPAAAIGLALSVLWPWFLVVPPGALLAVVAYAAAVAAAVEPGRYEVRPVRMRLAVGGLHAAQPFARTWGRLRGRRLEVERAAHPSWSGDRWDWLRQLRRELETRGCHVRVAEPRDSWDLEASAGPFVTARITTAVMWRWEPHAALRTRPRPVFYVLAALLAALALSGPWFGWPVLGLLVGLAALETVVVRQRVSEALRRTTRGAVL